jgi:hypothetical protein
MRTGVDDGIAAAATAFARDTQARPFVERSPAPRLAEEPIEFDTWMNLDLTSGRSDGIKSVVTRRCLVSPHVLRAIEEEGVFHIPGDKSQQFHWRRIRDRITQ